MKNLIQMALLPKYEKEKFQGLVFGCMDEMSHYSELIYKCKTDRERILVFGLFAYENTIVNNVNPFPIFELLCNDIDNIKELDYLDLERYLDKIIDHDI